MVMAMVMECENGDDDGSSHSNDVDGGDAM